MNRPVYRLHIAALALCGLLAAACGGDSNNTNQNNNGNANNNNAVPICGNQVVDSGEQCDDGAANSDTAPDACRTDCRFAYCGDGVPDSGEDCDDADDGNNGSDDCPNDCIAPTCGDGHIWLNHEECDDGNTDSNDGCRGDCLQNENLCGNSLLDPGEECDGGQLGGEDCAGQGFDGGILQCATQCTFDTTSCVDAVCGDGAIEFDEACDDGNLNTGDGCDDQCEIETGWSCANEPSQCSPGCGDGLVQGFEGCDDGNNADGDGCSASCFPETGWNCTGEPSVCTTTCGDGARGGTEGCDDGNTSVGDGCDASCQVETGWTCSGLTPDTCSAVCGDNMVLGTEVCDDGNTDDGDGCQGDCTTVEDRWQCTGSPSVCTCADYYTGVGCNTCRVFVDVNPGIATRNGASWATAHARVQDGIDTAVQQMSLVTTCEVWVAQGTYYTYETAQSDTVQMADNVHVYGGFNGTETQRSQRDWRANVTTLHGRDSTLTHSVWHVVLSASNSTIDGFTITGGGQLGNGPDPTGGGMMVNYSNQTVRNCTFSSNTASFSGGGIWFGGVSSGTVENCIFTNNEATSQGGGIFVCCNGQVSITNALIYGNTAPNGGGFATFEGQPTLTNVTITGNSATASGGGLWIQNFAYVELTNSIAYANSAPIDYTFYVNSNSTLVVNHSDVQWWSGPGTGNIDQDPIFVGGTDYHLQSGSPCIDVADDTAAPTTDLDGFTRVDQPGGTSISDMGAYEYGGS